MITIISQYYVRYKTVLRAALVVATFVVFRTAIAHAGSDSAFLTINELMKNWIEGSLGKALALIALLLGIGMAAARQSFASLFAGIGVAAGATVGPGIIETVVTGLF